MPIQTYCLDWNLPNQQKRQTSYIVGKELKWNLASVINPSQSSKRKIKMYMPMKRHTMLYPNAPDTKKSKHLNLKTCAKILPTQNHLKIGH